MHRSAVYKFINHISNLYLTGTFIIINSFSQLFFSTLYVSLSFGLMASPLLQMEKFKLEQLIWKINCWYSKFFLKCCFQSPRYLLLPLLKFSKIILLSTVPTMWVPGGLILRKWILWFPYFKTYIRADFLHSKHKINTFDIGNSPEQSLRFVSSWCSGIHFIHIGRDHTENPTSPEFAMPLCTLLLFLWFLV